MERVAHLVDCRLSIASCQRQAYLLYWQPTSVDCRLTAITAFYLFDVVRMLCCAVGCCCFCCCCCCCDFRNVWDVVTTTAHFQLLYYSHAVTLVYSNHCRWQDKYTFRNQRVTATCVVNECVQLSNLVLRDCFNTETIATTSLCRHVNQNSAICRTLYCNKLHLKIEI